MDTEIAFWKVVVDEGCIGAASCVGVSPTHFALGPDGRSRPRHPRTTPDDSVLDAAASCPMQAITVTDTRTGEVIET